MQIYELTKDIRTPNVYMAAGVRKTKEEWEAIYPNCFGHGYRQWFVEVIGDFKLDSSSSSALERSIMKQIFEAKGLYSFSYEQATLICMKILSGILRSKLSQNRTFKDDDHVIIMRVDEEKEGVGFLSKIGFFIEYHKLIEKAITMTYKNALIFVASYKHHNLIILPY